MTTKEIYEDEQAVLGSLSVRPGAIKERDLKPDEFLLPDNQLIYQAILDLVFIEGIPDDERLDTVLVRDRCFAFEPELMDKAGGPMQITQALKDIVALDWPTASGIRYYATKIRNRKQAKKLAAVALRLNDDLRARPVEDVLQDLQADVSEIAAGLTAENRMAKSVREWVEEQPGIFYTTDIYRYFKIREIRDKKNISQILRRMITDKLIDRYGDRAGCYRSKKSELVQLDWKNPSANDLNIRLPFGMERFFKIHPRTIMVFAGMSDAGKSALMFNVVKQNLSRWPINYFTSELAGSELRDRLSQFRDIEDPVRFFGDLKAYERSSDFHDVIRPDEINIVDYLHLSDQFFQVGQYIKQIHDRLVNGVAIICIQKDAKFEYGRGGSFGVETARLYATVDADNPGQVIRIKKIKNWRDPGFNPNKLMRRFKIAGGCNLIPTTDWEKE